MKKKDKTRKQMPQVQERPIRRSKHIFLACAGSVLILGTVAGIFLSRGPAVSAGAYAGYNLLLVTIDTVRADHLPLYGYEKVETPALDALASSSFIFENAICHAPMTLPSHASLLTGKLPIAHGIHDNSGYFLDQKDTTLAEMLKPAGYATAAFVSAFVLDSRWGLNQGFDYYFDDFNLTEHEGMNPRDVQRQASDTEREASKWLEANAARKWFCWVHFYDPHDPYTPPEPYRSRYAGHLYDGEIAYADAMLGKLIQKLETVGALDRTIVIVTSDHGEGLGDHSEPTHAMFLYRTTLHVPLIIRIPGCKGSRVRDLVQHIDVIPTILSLLGVQQAADLHGGSLLDLMNKHENKKRTVFSESRYAEIHYGWSPLFSVTADPYHYIDAPSPELYNWQDDPGEKKNLVLQEPSVAKVLRADLQQVLSQSGQKQAGPQKMDAETEEKLRALGYLSGSTPANAETRKIDPKDKIFLANAIQEASGLALAGNYPESLSRVLPVLQQDPSMPEALRIAGISYAGTGQYPEAIDAFLKLIRLRPDDIVGMYNLGYAYEVTGDLKSAEYWYGKLLQVEPDHISAKTRLIGVYRNRNRMDLALPQLQQVLRSYQESLEKTKSGAGRASLYASMGEVYFLAGDLVKAEESLKSAVRSNPDQPNIHYNLAQIYDVSGRTEDAIKEYRLETDRNPANYLAFHNLGILYIEKNEFENASLCFETVVRLNPRDPSGYVQLASVYRKLGRVQEADAILRSVRQADRGER